MGRQDRSTPRGFLAQSTLLDVLARVQRSASVAKRPNGTYCGLDGWVPPYRGGLLGSVFGRPCASNRDKSGRKTQRKKGSGGGGGGVVATPRRSSVGPFGYACAPLYASEHVKQRTLGQEPKGRRSILTSHLVHRLPGPISPNRGVRRGGQRLGGSVALRSKTANPQ